MNTQAATLLRVVRQTKSRDKTFDPVTIWIGFDPKMLSMTYPLANTVSEQDKLSTREFRDGDVVVTHWFEQQQPDGSWQKCDDPRSAVDLM